MNDLIVVKFGGSVLEGGKSIRKAAETIKKGKEQGKKMVVVVSAMKGITDKITNPDNQILKNFRIPIVNPLICIPAMAFNQICHV